MSIFGKIKSEMMNSTALGSVALNHLVKIDGIQVNSKIAQEMEGIKIHVGDIVANGDALAIQGDRHPRVANDNFAPVSAKKAA